MNQTTTLAARCDELFTSYPEAVEEACEQDCGPGVAAMTLMAADGGTARFFRLLDTDAGFSACERGRAPALLGGGADPGVCEGIASGWPLPADRSLFGWQEGGIVSALITFYTHDLPEPRWSLCPHADMPDAWPPFYGRHLFGPWFWEYLRAGNIVNLRGLVGSSEGTVFWVDTVASLGSGSTAVARDLAGGDRTVLPRGRYVYAETLRAGTPLPSLDDLLADPSRVDLGPRFPLS